MAQFESLSTQSTDNFGSNKSLYKFNDRLNNESYKNLIDMRNKIFLRMSHKDRSTSCQNMSIWEKKPVDFTRKLYDPHPPKRNTQAAIKPWEYDRFLRSAEDENIFWEKEEPKKTVASQVLDSAFSNTYDNWQKDFEASFRLETPNGARMNAAHSMSFREGLNQFKNPKDHDFRGLHSLSNQPEFIAKNDKDPQKLKFLSKNLNQIHGLSDGTCLRDVEDDQQMGDPVKKKEPQYDPKLILPRLAFPNKYNAYTRNRTTNNSADDAYWERLIPELNRTWANQK